MVRGNLHIINKLGLHARAASKFVSCASRFASSIKVAKRAPEDGEAAADSEPSWSDGKSIMAVMMLAAGRETILDVEIEGEDETEAFDALSELVADRFGEDE